MSNQVSQNISKAVREIEFVKIWSWSEYIVCQPIKIVRMYIFNRAGLFVSINCNKQAVDFVYEDSHFL